VSGGNHLGLLLTFELEIPIANRIVFREIIAVMTRPDRPPSESVQWLSLGAHEHSVANGGVWDRLFAVWAEEARPEAELLAGRIASQRYTAFVARYEALRQEETTRSRHWLRVKADHLCGPFIPPTADLFGVAEPGPVWRTQEDPASRLISLATCRDIPVSKRRDANDALEIFRSIEPSDAMPGPIVSRPIGMLMLVPRDVC
jgi:hypothetical protein